MMIRYKLVQAGGMQQTPGDEKQETMGEKKEESRALAQCCRWNDKKKESKGRARRKNPLAFHQPGRNRTAAKRINVPCSQHLNSFFSGLLLTSTHCSGSCKKNSFSCTCLHF